MLVEGEGCKNTAKGVRKSVKDTQISFEDYEHALTTLEVKSVSMNRIASTLHVVHSMTTRKVALSAFDDKRYICDDGISTLAHGHCDIARPHGKKRERPAEGGGRPGDLQAAGLFFQRLALFFDVASNTNIRKWLHIHVYTWPFNTVLKYSIKIALDLRVVVVVCLIFVCVIFWCYSFIML